MIITGNEKAFAAGADIKEMADKTYNEALIGNFAGDWDERGARAQAGRSPRSPASRSAAAASSP